MTLNKVVASSTLGFAMFSPYIALLRFWRLKPERECEWWLASHDGQKSDDRTMIIDLGNAPCTPHVCIHP